MVATFLTTCLMAVLQPSRYSVFHSEDTPIQLSLSWQSYSYQCLNTETSAQDNRGFPTETPSISYNISLYIRVVPQVCSSPSPFCRLLPQCKPRLTVLSDFQVCCHFWAVLPTKLSVVVPSAIHFTLHFKVQIASFCRNSSTPVPPLRTLFNTILRFSDQMAYPPNAPQCSRQLH